LNLNSGLSSGLSSNQLQEPMLNNDYHKNKNSCYNFNKKIAKSQSVSCINSLIISFPEITQKEIKYKGELYFDMKNDDNIHSIQFKQQKIQSFGDRLINQSYKATGEKYMGFHIEIKSLSTLEKMTKKNFCDKSEILRNLNSGSSSNPLQEQIQKIVLKENQENREEIIIQKEIIRISRSTKSDAFKILSCNPEYKLTPCDRNFNKFFNYIIFFSFFLLLIYFFSQILVFKKKYFFC